MDARYGTLDVNNKLIWNLRDIGDTMHRIREGRGSQRRVLILLRESGATTQRELTKRMGVQPGSASEVIGKLEAAGQILRTPSKTDRRTSDIRLTRAGQNAAAEACFQREARHEQMFSCLSPEEKLTLLELLERVNECWDGYYRKNDTKGRRRTVQGARHVEVH